MHFATVAASTLSDFGCYVPDFKKFRLVPRRRHKGSDACNVVQYAVREKFAEGAVDGHPTHAKQTNECLLGGKSDARS